MTNDAPRHPAAPPQRRPLPRGRHALPRDEVVASQRQRLIDATLIVAAERGYAGASVSQVVAAARVSRETFYGLFESKEACWDEAIAFAVHVRETALLDALAGPGDAMVRVRAGVAAFLEAVEANPHAARCIAAERPPHRGGTPAALVDSRSRCAAALGEVLGVRDPFLAGALATTVDTMVNEEVAASGPEGLRRLGGPLGRLLETVGRSSAW